jgi:hypothetical protein
VPGYYSVEWDGSLKAPVTGDYSFSINSNSYGLLELDGSKAVERPFLPEQSDWAERKVHLTAGRHRLRLRYYEARHYSRFELWWAPPGGSREVVPSSVLSTR